jgi:hypothetical protein
MNEEYNFSLVDLACVVVLCCSMLFCNSTMTIMLFFLELRTSVIQTAANNLFRPSRCVCVCVCVCVCLPVLFCVCFRACVFSVSVQRTSVSCINFARALPLRCHSAMLTYSCLCYRHLRFAIEQQTMSVCVRVFVFVSVCMSLLDFCCLCVLSLCFAMA